MKLIAKFLAATVLFAGLNHAFAADGRKEAVLDMGKGAFTLTVSVPATADGPYDFGKNPGIGSKMTGQFQHQEVMFGNRVNNSTKIVSYKVTAQKIDPNKKGQKLTAEHMAKDQIKAEGFKDREEQIDCPPSPVEGATVLCYKMSGTAIFGQNKKTEKNISYLMSVSWANDTQGYTLMGTAIEESPDKFQKDPSDTDNSANKALSSIWKFHKITKN